MQIFSTEFNKRVSFKRYFENDAERLKHYELNRNKALSYVLNKSDLDFVDFVLAERKKSQENISPKITKHLGKISYNRDGIIKYNTFSYPQLYRGIGQSELDALKEGKQIYSEQRKAQFGVDVTNHPGGIGYGDYLVKFKMKPNLDHYISDCYAYKFELEGVPHVACKSDDAGSRAHHSILRGAYTLSDVQQITELKTNKVVYDANNEKIPNYKKLQKMLHSAKEEDVIDAVEKMQIHYGDGRFVNSIKFLMLSENPKIQEACLNAFYNYGKEKDFDFVLDFAYKSDRLENRVIARLANCVEKLGKKNNCDDIIKNLIDKLCKNKADENTIYAFKNIEDAMRKTNFCRSENYKILKQYATQKASIPLKAVALRILATSDCASCVQIVPPVGEQNFQQEFLPQQITKYTEEEIQFLKKSLDFYQEIAPIKRKYRF